MPETVTFEHYEVLTRTDGSLHELGRGAMGVTYKGFDTQLRVPVTLKVINAAHLHSESARQRFVREARAAAQLRHRNVASVFHLGEEGGNYFYVMEFIDGETVEALVQRRGALSPAFALRIAAQVARALNAAQMQDLVHRDIKPSNLMAVMEDGELVIKVIDFGLAKALFGEGDATSAALTRGGILGTPHFASPEQLGEHGTDIRSDIYSLGVTLWFLLTAATPFKGSVARVIAQHLSKPPPFDELGAVPSGVVDILRRMLAKDPAERPQSPADLRTELEQCLKILTSSDRTTEARSAATPAPEEAATLEPATGRRNLLLPVLVLLAVAAVSFAFFYAWRRLPGQHPAAAASLPVTPSPHPIPPAPPATTPNPATPLAVSPSTPVPSPLAVPATPPPAPSRHDLANEARRAAETLEDRQHSREALTAWLRMAKSFPEIDTGRLGLELLINRLRRRPGGFSRAEFASMQADIRQAAKMGVVSAMMALAEELRESDPKQAFAWSCAAATAGDPAGMTQAGLMLSNGAGAPRDLRKAVAYFQAATDQGEPIATGALADCYLDGNGVPADPQHALALLRKAAEKGNARAINRLGWCYDQGIGVARNPREAFRLFSEAASGGSVEAIGNLGVLYMKGEGVEKSEARAAEKLKEASRKGDLNGIYYYAVCLESGRGEKPNAQAARSLFQKAAAAGHPGAIAWCQSHRAMPIAKRGKPNGR